MRRIKAKVVLLVCRSSACFFRNNVSFSFFFLYAMAQVLQVAPTSLPENNENSSEETELLENIEDTSSVDTQDAFLNMLGLPSENGVPSLNDVEEEHQRDIAQTTKFNQYFIHVPSRCSRYLHSPGNCLAFAIRNFYSKQECQQLIRRATTATNQGFQYIREASHIAPDGSSYSVKLQNPNPHKLSVFDHPPSISRMWGKLEPLIFPLIQDFIDRENCGSPLGLNPRLRVLRYDSTDNDRFEPHFDATTMAGNDKKSLLTVLLYLNDGGGKDFGGGETLFLDSHISSKTRVESSSLDSRVRVTPETGTVVIFEHDLFHSGAPLLFGTKFVLRTDVLFAVKKDPSSSKHHIEDKQAPKSDIILVSNLCDHLNLPTERLEMLTQVLKGMGMFEITLESFLAPGPTMLKAMLMDEITDKSLVDEIIYTANKLADRVNVK